MVKPNVNTINKNKTVAGVLALLLGSFGAHKFYLGKYFWGFTYLLLSWTFIPMVISFIESIIYFTMSERKFTEKYLVNAGNSSKKETIHGERFKCVGCGKENLVALKDGYSVEVGFFLCRDCNDKFKRGDENINKLFNQFLDTKPELKKDLQRTKKHLNINERVVSESLFKEKKIIIKKEQTLINERVSWKKAYKEIAKNYKIFKLVGYKGGIPGFKKGFMRSLHICATNQGILFINQRSYKPESIIPWNWLVHIATSTEMKPTWQALTTGMAAQMKTIGDGIATGLVAGITEKNPLIFCVKQNVNDNFTQEIKFDDRRNEKIKIHIMEMRVKLFPKGISQNITANQDEIDNSDSIEKIKKLAKLKQQGIITQEEFDMKKKSLLDRI